MLSAIILNLGLFKKPKPTVEPIRQLLAGDERPLPLEIRSFDASFAKIWLERGDNEACNLQLFCPGYEADRAGTIELAAFGQIASVDYEAGAALHDVLSSLAAALDEWFDVTPPPAGQRSERACLSLRPKTRAGTAGSSTDGMVLLSCDGRGFDIEVGLDEPIAMGGVITIATSGRMARYTTTQGQHGGEVVQAIAHALADMGCIVDVRHQGCDDTYRARIDIMAVYEKAIPAQLQLERASA